MKKLNYLISIKKSMLLAIILINIFCQCGRKNESNKYNASFPLLGEWAGEISYVIENGDTIKTVENTERFLVMEDSIHYSFFGDDNYTGVSYFHKGDTFIIKNTNSIILELNETRLIRKTTVSDSKCWIFIYKRQ